VADPFGPPQPITELNSPGYDGEPWVSPDGKTIYFTRAINGVLTLMYAALYAGPDCLKLLIDHGAPINAINGYGASALMWAASQTANVKLLVDRGADVNARASDGVTPLVAAARLDNPEAMRILLAAGADTNAQETRTNLLTAAYFAPTSDIRNVLADAHVAVRYPADVKGPVLNRNRGDVDALKRLLDAGVKPNEEVPLITLSLPSFFMAAREGQLEAMEAFVDAGFDPANGFTPDASS